MKYTPIYFTAAALAALIAPMSSRAEDPAPPPAAKWQSSAAAGLTLTRGNSDTLLATLTLTTAKKWEQNELSMDADATYGKSKVNVGGTTVNQTTAQQLHGFVQYNRLFTERWYGYGRVEGLHDEVADIKYRVTLSPGVGYYFIKSTNTDLSAEAGPGYVIEKLGDRRENYATLRVGEKFHHALSDRSRVWQTAEWLPQVDKFNNYILNFEIGIEADLSAAKTFSLRSYLQDTYNNVPAAGRQKNDAKLVAAIAYKF